MLSWFYRPLQSFVVTTSTTAAANTDSVLPAGVPYGVAVARIGTNTGIWYRVGKAGAVPVADKVNGIYLPPDVWERIAVNPGEGFSVLADSAAGKCSFTLEGR